MVLQSVRRVPAPLYPTFPKDEFGPRYRRAREAMDKLGIDVLLVTERENVVYFTGLQSCAWIQKGVVPAVVLLHVTDPEPIMLLPDFWLGTAEKTTWIDDFVLHHDSHSDPDDFARLIADTVRQRGWANGRIGYEGGPEMIMGMPLRQYERLRSELAGMEWVDGGEAIWSARLIKSQREVERLRRSAVATNRAQERLREYVRPGVREIEIGTFLRRAMLEEANGAEEDRFFLNMRAGRERYSMTDTLPQERPVQPGEVMVVDAGILLEGYASDTARVMTIGEPSSLYESVYSVVIDAEREALKVVRPGTPASEVYRAVRQVFEDAGLPPHIDMVGHSIGLDAHEPPMLSPIIDVRLQENMVINIEPWVTLPNDQGVLVIEDTFHVTQDGYDQLTLDNASHLWTTG